MKERATLQQLKSDLQRWRSLLPEAEGTKCQGIANKAFGEFELLLKQLVDERLAATNIALPDLLKAVRYTGNVRSVKKLPAGTLVQVLVKLGERDYLLRDTFSNRLRQVLDEVVPARNDTTHEVLAPDLRARTSRLLDLIDEAVQSPELARLLD